MTNEIPKCCGVPAMLSASGKYWICRVQGDQIGLVEHDDCFGDEHVWPECAAEGDTCNCGAWYRFKNRIKETPEQS